MCLINLVIGFEVMKSNILLLRKHQMTPQMTQFLFAILNETNKLFSSDWIELVPQLLLKLQNLPILK